MKLVEDHLRQSKKPLIVVIGPTASGKTNFAVELANEISGEIINADSRQLFRHMQIGTAKVTEEEMHGIPHHLIDVLDPKEEATVGRFQREALKVIDDVLERGSVPILVGGSMLYVSSIIDGLELGTIKNDKRRAELEAAYDADGGRALYARLTEIDPEAAGSIHQNNKPRVVRALEIAELHEKPQVKNVPYDVLLIGLGSDREETVVKINNRTEAMFAAGWIDEVQKLLDEGYSESDPGMKAAGYKEIMQYIREGDSDIEKLKEMIAAKTRQYARRQMTWWKKDPRIQWV